MHFKTLNHKSNPFQFLKERNDPSIITSKIKFKLDQTKKNIKTKGEIYCGTCI
jgi:hypothetical protein